MVSNTANGIARNTSATLMSQKWTSQPLSWVGKKASLVGRLSRDTCFILPMCTKPVKKMTVSGVP